MTVDLIAAFAATLGPALLLALIAWALYDADDPDFTIDDYRPRPGELHLVSSRAVVARTAAGGAR